jgi:hypothetical protein
MAGSDVDPLSLPDPLDPIRRALADLTATLRQHAAGAERDHLLGLVGDLRATLEGVAGTLRARTAEGPPTPEALDTWLHDLRGPLGAMLGWATLFSPERDATTRARAVEAIDRNAKLLVELLGHPPG